MHSSGDWFGFHCIDPQTPRTFMIHFHITVSAQGGAPTLTIQGKATRVDRYTGTLEGSVDAIANPEGQFKTEIRQVSNREERVYSGVFDLEREIISGAYRSDVDVDLAGSFIFKKTPTAAIMCHRPLVPRLGVRALWTFAIDTVLDALRSRRPSLAYLYGRAMMTRRFLELMSETALSPEETAELRTLSRRFTVQAGAEIYAMALWYRRVGDLQE